MLRKSFVGKHTKNAQTLLIYRNEQLRKPWCDVRQFSWPMRWTASSLFGTAWWIHAFFGTALLALQQGCSHGSSHWSWMVLLRRYSASFWSSALQSGESVCVPLHVNFNLIHGNSIMRKIISCRLKNASNRVFQKGLIEYPWRIYTDRYSRTNDI